MISIAKQVPRISTMEKEWITCPRCKNKRMTPNKMGTKPNGKVWIWWMCENNKVCQFPFDMPAQVYHSEQTAEQAASGYFPLPRILSLPQKFYHLYPITFASYFQEKRCSSSASVQRSTCDSGLSSSSDGVSSSTESPPQQNSVSRPVNSMAKECVGNEPSCSTSEGIANVDDRGYEIDNEEMETNKKRRPMRTVKKEGFFDTDKSWSKLIAKIAQNNQDYSSFLNIDEEQLMSRVKGIVDEIEVTKSPIAFTQKSRRRTMQLDDHDTAMRQYPLNVRWGIAKDRLLRMPDTLKDEIKHAPNVEKVFKVIGEEIKPSTSSCTEMARERAKVLSGRIERVLKRMHQPDDVDERIKRQKLETERRRQNLCEKRKNAVMSLAKSRVLSRLSNIERPTPSITPYSSVASPFYDTTPQPSPANYVANEFSLDLSGLHDDYQQPMQQYQPLAPEPVEVAQAHAQEREPEQQHQQLAHHDDLDLDQLLFDNLNDVNFTGNLEDDQHQHHNYDNYNDDDYEDLQF